MSRVGRKVISLPAKVKAVVVGQKVEVEGPHGKLALQLPVGIVVKIENTSIVVSCLKDAAQSKDLSSKYGLVRALVDNMVVGVSELFKEELEVNGVGYRIEIKGQDLLFMVGYSHSVSYHLPDSVKGVVEKQTKLILTCPDKQLLGQVVAQIRGIKPPEPYKAKGIKRVSEVVKRKAGKAAAGSGGKGK